MDTIKNATLFGQSFLQRPWGNQESKWKSQHLAGKPSVLESYLISKSPGRSYPHIWTKHLSITPSNSDFVHLSLTKKIPQLMKFTRPKLVQCTSLEVEGEVALHSPTLAQDIHIFIKQLLQTLGLFFSYTNNCCKFVGGQLDLALFFGTTWLESTSSKTRAKKNYRKKNYEFFLPDHCLGF